MAECNSTCSHFHYVNLIELNEGKLVLSLANEPQELTNGYRLCFRFDKSVPLPDGYFLLPICVKIAGNIVPICRNGNCVYGSSIITSSDESHACQNHVYTGIIVISEDNTSKIEMDDMFYNIKDIIDQDCEAFT